jgi:ATP-dependent Lon protease
VLQLLKLPDGTVKVLVEGSQRARVREFDLNAEHITAEIDLLSEPEADGREAETLSRSSWSSSSST